MKATIVLAALVLVTILLLGVIFLVKIGAVHYTMVTAEHGRATMISIARSVVPATLDSSESVWGSGEAVSIAWLSPPSRLDGAPALPAPPPPLLRQ